MSDQEKPPESAATPTSKSPSFVSEMFSQANITTALAVFAVILAAAPYVVPQVQAWQVRKGLMTQPAMLVDASNRLQEQQTADAARAASTQIKAHHDSIFNDKNDPVINPGGKIKVVEFLDYECAYCRAFTPVLRDFLKANPDVQLVVKEYPVVHPPESIAMAQIGMAAYQAGHYEPVHYAFLNATPKSDAELDAVLAKAGLDPKAIRDAATSAPVKAHVQKTVELGADLGINGTPTFIIGDTEIAGARIDQLQAVVEAARAGK